MSVRQVLLLEGGINLLVLMLKLGVGIASGSAAVLGDALHSLTDLANNGFALVAVRVSEKPPDENHPYGHGKFETLAVFTLAVLLCVVAIELVLHAIGRAGQPVTSTPLQFSMMLLVLGLNLFIAAFESRAAKRLNSDILAADAGHTLSDVATTFVVIAGWQAGARGYVWVDSVFAFAVAGLVGWLAWGLFRRAIPRLVDEAAADPRHVANQVRRVAEVRSVRRVRTRVGGHGKAAADIIVTIDGELSTEEGHRVADAIEATLEKQLGIQDVTVHLEPSES